MTEVMVTALEDALIAFIHPWTRGIAPRAILHALNAAIITTVRNAYQVDMAHFVHRNVRVAKMVSVTKTLENVHWVAIIIFI